MARSFYRTLVISSFFAAIGSFLIDLGNETHRIATLVTAAFEELFAMDRGLAIYLCLMVIVFSAIGIAVIQLIRGGRSR